MLTDRYDLPLSTTSPAARDAYVQACERLLTMYPGAIEAFDQAIAADPGFALAHAGKARSLLDRGNAVAARDCLAAAKALAVKATEREASHVAFCEVYAAGHVETSLAALRAHLATWPRDALVLSTAAFTNGLIGSSGQADQKRTLLAFLDSLAPTYGDDWWFMAHHGMALSENGQYAAAQGKIERSLAQNPSNAWVAHARAHLSYETGDPHAAHDFLATWLTTYPRDAPLYSHLSWHLALCDLGAGNPDHALRLFREAFSPDVHSGPPRAKVTDAMSFLWRWELAGYPRDAGAWRMMHEFAVGALPRAGIAFSDMHIALGQAVAGDDAALDDRAQQMEDLAREGRYPSGAFVPALCRAFAAFERRDFAAAIEAIEPLAGELERIGGSRAQLDLIEFTLLKACLDAGRVADARRLLSQRKRGPSAIPVAGMKAME
jgi:tetratricopeptide (TPR) repeat protein